MTIKPGRPNPLTVPDIEFKVFTKEKPPKEGVWMALDWQDYLTFSQYLQDIKGKFYEYNHLLNYYEGMIDSKKAP